MQKFFLFLFLFQFTAAMAWAGDHEPAKLDDLVAEALNNNPQLRAAREAVRAAQTRIRQATSLEAPQAGFEFYQTPVKSFPNPVNDGMETDYYLQQMFPFPGTLAGMGKAARSYAEMTAQDYKSQERKIIRDLKAAYYELYLLERELGINNETQDLLRELIKIAIINYEVGRGNQAGILRLQTELSSLVIGALDLGKKEKVAEAEVNTILGRQVYLPVGPVPDIEITFPELSVSSLDSFAIKSRPELKGMEYNIKMNEAELYVSRKEQWPEFMVRLMYKDMKMTGNDYWSTMVGFSIPRAFWSRKKYDSRIEENRINIRRAEEDYSSMRNMVVFQVHEAFENLETGRQTILYYRDNVLPQAEQTMQSMLASYRAATVDFLMVLDAARMLLDSRLEYQMGIMNYLISQSDLELALGADLASITANTH